MEKLKIGIFVHGDPTRGGTIASEVKFLRHLYETNSQDCDFYILPVNPSVTKRILKEKELHYDFPHKVVPMMDPDNMDLLGKFHAIVTWVGHTNFYGGLLNENIVRLYKLISNFTNKLQRPAFIRVNDSEGRVRDYRYMASIRLQGKAESSFNATEENRKSAENLVMNYPEWDYSKCYWLANGAKEIYDWLPETMWDREDEDMRRSTREQIEANTVYLSDDIFFMVRHNYKRFENLSRIQRSDSLCYIGFFDTFNTKRAKAFENVWKPNKHKVPLKIFGKGTENIKKITGSDFTHVDIEEGWVRGDSPEFFDFLNKHIGYVFVGKGNPINRYINKTIYDAVVARTPIITYRPCDTNHVCMTSDELYFENEEQLNAIYQKLLIPTERERILQEQAQDIFNRLPIPSFRFSSMCSGSLLPILDDECAKLTQMTVSRKSSQSVALF
jgi:hypothetical protein